MKRLLIALCFSTTVIVASAEIREWSDKKGNSVKAEFREMEAGKAVLIREDGKKVKVDPTLLSAADQAYIKTVLSAAEADKKGAEEKNEPKFIATTEARIIAQNYVEYLAADREDRLKMNLNPANLFADREKAEQTVIRDYYFSEDTKYFSSVKRVDKKDYGFCIKVEFRSQEGLESTYWIQMLPDGKIKYDSIFIDHPLISAMSYCYSVIYSTKNDRDYTPTDELTDLGIPLFGYSPQKSREERIKSLEKIQDWLLSDEAEDWDTTEPKVKCLEDLYKSYRDSLKSVNL